MNFYVRKVILFHVFSIILLACNSRVAIENSQEDINEGIEYMKKFHTWSNEGNFDSLYAYFNISKYDSTLRKNRERLNSLLGENISYETSRIYSKNIKYKNPGTDTIYYRYEVIGKFDRGIAEEVISFEKVGGRIYYKENHINIP